MWEYTEKVHDYFLNPRNAGLMENPSAVGEVGSLACGDALKLYLKIENEIITDAKFQTFGCASAIASSSALTEIIIGKTVDEAAKITNKEIAEYLGGLPPEKMHCSVMGEEALEAAIRNHKGLPPLEHIDDHSPLVCKCFGITEKQIVDVIHTNGLKNALEVTNFTKAGGACGQCNTRIEELLVREGRKLIEEEAREIKPVQKSTLTNVQRMKKVMEVIEKDIRPRLVQDGGDIELIDVDGTQVVVALRGKCSSCRASHLTLKNLVEKTLKEQVEPAIEVVEA